MARKFTFFLFIILFRLHNERRVYRNATKSITNRHLQFICIEPPTPFILSISANKFKNRFKQSYDYRWIIKGRRGMTATKGVRAVLQASCVPVWGHVWYSNWLALHIKGHSADAKRTLITLRVCVCIVRYRCRNIRRKIILNSRKTLWKPVRALSLICRRSRDNLEFRTRYNVKLWKACWLSYILFNASATLIY